MTISIQTLNAKARSMTKAQLAFALADVRATLAIWDRDAGANPAYLAKLRAEFDAYTVESHKRIHGRHRMPSWAKLTEDMPM